MKHKHKWMHIVTRGRCMDKSCKRRHFWLIHKCEECGVTSIALKIERDKEK